MTGLLLIAAVAVAQDEAPDDDFRGYIDQAKFYIRKGWWPDAEEQLEAAVAHPDGVVDPEAWNLLAQVRLELADIPGAREAASRAHTYARDDEQLALNAGLSTFLHEQFGIVQVTAPYPGLAARLSIELTSVLYDPAQVAALEKIQDGYKRKIVLPQTFGLPVGTYVINGREVAVSAQTPTVLALRSDEMATRGPTAAKLLQLEAGVGVAAWLGSDVYNLAPTFNLQGAASVPLGPGRVALILDWIPTRYTLVDGTTHVHAAGGSIGARYGIELDDAEPFVIRPSIGYRYAWVPGIELRCTAEGGEYACSTDNDATDLVLYAVGRAHVPMVELSVALLDERRTSGVGFGVKGVVEYAFGTLPARGDAAFVSDVDAFEFSVEPGSKAWSAFGVRVLAHVTVAF